MVCSSWLRSIIAGVGILSKSKTTINVNAFAIPTPLVNCCNFNNNNHRPRSIYTSSARMMFHSANMLPAIDVPPQKDDGGGFVGGGWKREDGKLSCGYSSFRGKRVSMEDYFDIKNTVIDGQTVCMFGIFDGHGGYRAAEYLKDHLFENLMNHPKFLSDTKLAISETFQQTDVDFLNSEKESYRDDGSTASTAVLVGNHLYVANVGDSRTVISKSGKEPEIQDLYIDEEFELLVLATDGLWDVVPNEDAVALAQAEDEAEAGSRKLTEVAFSRGSADNITCIVVRFHHQKSDSADQSGD